MLRILPCATLAILAATATNRSSAETSSVAGPPAWRDNASVYLNSYRSVTPASAPASDKAEPVRLASNVGETIATPHPTSINQLAVPTKQPIVDSSVHYAFNQAEAAPTANDSQRRLPPPSAPIVAMPHQLAASADSPRLPSLAPRWESIGSTVSALGVVIGFFLICAWLLRRGTRKSSAALPRDVVSVLGRVPLAARNVAQLLRVGNKLVLVSLTPAGAETLTEVTDPAEVDRLVGLCHQSDPHSTTKAFEHVFRQLSLEPAHDGVLGNDALRFRGDAVRG